MFSTDVSAGIPVHNSADKLARTIINLRACGIEQILVLDDGSQDNSAGIASGMGVKVLQHARRLGRGAARARLIQETKTAYLLQVDAGNLISENFCSVAYHEIQQPNVGAVFGRVEPPKGELHTAARWGARHLFKSGAPRKRNEKASLATGGVMLNREMVIGVGNFSEHLAAREDEELGKRLLLADYKVIFNPEISVISASAPNWEGAFKRYFRWNIQRQLSWREYLNQIGYAYKTLLKEDVAAGDYRSALLTLLLPHYLFLASRRAL